MSSVASQSRFKVLLTDRPWLDADLERSILRECGAELIEAPSGDEATLRAHAHSIDAIATVWAQVTPAVIDSARSTCRVISRLGIGLDNIAVEHATAVGIPVTNVPDYCVGETADHAMALLLAAARNIAFFHLRTKREEYALARGPIMHRLAGSTLGLFGFGRIARNLAQKARAFGMRIMAHTPSGNDYGLGVEMVSFETLLRDSDFLSLHAPLVAATCGRFGWEEFRQMRPAAWIINTSRGAVIREDELWRALQQGCLAGAALDVFHPEPPSLAHPLFRDERVIVTPHAAFVSEESVRELRTRAFRQIVAVLQGKRPEHVVNPQVYSIAPDA